MVLLLPSDPVTVTPVAFVAVTVNVDEAPAATVVGLAVMVTVAAAVVPLAVPAEPHPATSRNGEQIITIAMSDSIERNRETRRWRERRTFTMGESFLLQMSDDEDST
jgi:hypothetical protein